MIRVAFICDSFDIGGQELGCLELMQRLDRNKFAPFLYAFRPGGLINRALSLGIPAKVGVEKPASDPYWNGTDDIARAEYRDVLRWRLHEDRIDACLLYAWPDGIGSAQKAGVRAIIERVDGISLASRLNDKSACARVICEAKTVRDVILAQGGILKCRPEQIVVIPNGIDLERFDPSRYDRERCRAALGLTEDDFVIGTVARLAPEKNLEHMLRSIEFMTRNYPSRGAMVRLVLVGPDAGSRGQLKAEAARLGIAHRTKFLSFHREVPEVLRALDVYAITSFYEGTPFALLEAMAMGLPIVATHVGAIPEIIDGNGYLVSVIHPEDAAKAYSQLLSNLPLRRELASRSRTLAKEYDVNRMVRRYEQVLLESLEGKTAGLPAMASGGEL